ncbi:cupin domain-containing protein [Rubrivivax sp. RP6-9]|uniref:cupin domain-containing protein n=1 Tax=Rubrivivax sp. RP6-9 TaxID=3415750 RepID=UPI003CC6A2E8
MKSSTLVGAALLVAIGGAITLTQAQQPAGIKRSAALQHDLGVADRTVIQVRVDFAPGASFGSHTHPGAEVAYVLEGTIEYELQGRAPLQLKAGEALFIPAGVVHAARNVGAGNAAELATCIVEKNKPILSMTK